jgi:hypothetical protein
MDIRLTVTLILALVAFLLTIAAAMNPPKAPLWIAVLLLTIIAMLNGIPLR